MISRNHMKKNIIAGIVALVFITSAASAAPASALTVEDIQAQIKSLLARVANLQLQLRTTVPAQTPPVDPTTTSVSPAKHRICSILARNLSQGTRGDDVRGLQEFLSAEGHLSANATGYFGPATAQAVAKWQTSEGVSSVGSVGPMSRERIKIWCGNSSLLKASPQSGQAPLEVTFTARPSSGSGYTYVIDFGDGQESGELHWAATDCVQGATCDGRAFLLTGHTYSFEGTYTATLYQNHPGGCGPNADPRCLGAPAMHAPLAHTQIRVGATIGCTKEYSPVCGSKPIVCITTPCNPIQQTYGNRCEMNADAATFVHEGTCRDAGNRPPTISSFSGPTTLSVNQSGTWTIQATDPENGPLSYFVGWADERLTTPASLAEGHGGAFYQNTTFTHSYSSPGTYTITAIVKDNAGLDAGTTMTVRVGESQPVACTMDARQCPNGSYVGRSGPNCQFVCPN